MHHVRPRVRTAAMHLPPLRVVLGDRLCFQRALRQLRLGNIALIATLPVLDCL